MNLCWNQQDIPFLTYISSVQRIMKWALVVVLILVIHTVLLLSGILESEGAVNKEGHIALTATSLELSIEFRSIRVATWKKIHWVWAWGRIRF